MTQQGDPLAEELVVCPFVAVELDPDWRSDHPDNRHRCFAEEIPKPPSPAHQEAYCLSPSFTACPIFLNWAKVAAARPLPVTVEGSAKRPVTPAQLAEPDHQGRARPTAVMAAVLTLLLVAVILLPTLLGNPGALQTPTPSLIAAAPTVSASQLPSTTPAATATPTLAITPAATPTPTPAVPTTTPTPSPTPFVYVVAPGDVLGAIARRFGVSVASILAANPWITDPNRIQRGWEIIIPLPAGNLPSPTP